MVSFLDKLILFFFVTLAFFLPISNTGVEISFALILLGMTAKAFIEKPSLKDVKLFFTDRINLAVLVFYLLIGLSLFASGPLFSKSLRAWITKWGEGVMLFYLARIFLNKKQLKTLLLVLLAATFLVCIDGVYQRMTGVDFLRGFELNTVDAYTAVRASFNHYNDFAAFLVTMFFVNLGVFGTLKKAYLKLLSVSLALLIILNMAFAYSRGSWVAFFIVCFFLAAFVSNRKIKALLISMLSIFLIGLFAAPVLRERLILIVQKGGDAGRFSMWKSAIAIFESSPVIGCGLGLFMDKVASYGTTSSQYAHNCYLQILAETGILGLGGFLWIIGQTATRACITLKKRLDVVSLGIFSGFSAFLIHAFFDTQLFSLKLSVFFWLLIALLAKSLEEEAS